MPRNWRWFARSADLEMGRARLVPGSYIIFERQNWTGAILDCSGSCISGAVLSAKGSFFRGIKALVGIWAKCV